MGMRGTCPGEMVTYTCTVNQGAVLEWIVEPFLPDNDPVQFTRTDTIGRRFDCNDVTALQCADFNFVATLTDIANPSTSVADVTSTLTFTATSTLNGTVIQCRGVTANATPMNSSTHSVASVHAHVVVLVQCSACF